MCPQFLAVIENGACKPSCHLSASVKYPESLLVTTKVCRTQYFLFSSYILLEDMAKQGEILNKGTRAIRTIKKEICSTMQSTVGGIRNKYFSSLIQMLDYLLDSSTIQRIIIALFSWDGPNASMAMICIKKGIACVARHISLYFIVIFQAVSLFLRDPYQNECVKK